jgi:hypothetical protein
MKESRNTHVITLPEVQAKGWCEACTELGIFAQLSGGPDAFELAKKGQMVVVTTCTDEDRNIAWELFKEQFSLKVGVMS